MSFDAFQVVVLGCATGFGSALGTEIAKTLVTTVKEKGKKENVH